MSIVRRPSYLLAICLTCAGLTVYISLSLKAMQGTPVILIQNIFQTGLSAAEELETTTKTAVSESSELSNGIELLSKVKIKPSTCNVIAPDGRNHHPKLLIIINSACRNEARRNVTRETWAEKTTTLEMKMRVIFVLAYNEEFASEVMEESNAFDDILQIADPEDYRTMSQKVVTALDWVIHDCEGFHFLVKTDDDMHVDVFSINKALETVKDPSRTIFCAFAADWKPIRHSRHKNVLTEQEYPRKVLPPFCRGSLYILPRSLVIPMYRASFLAFYVWLEDVFITGLIPEYLAEHNVTHVQFEDWNEHGNYDHNKKTVHQLHQFWYTHHYDEQSKMRYEMWSELKKRRRT